jgi:hypothetical protein
MGSAGAGGIPDIPTGTGTGAGDLDEIFGKSLGDYDGAMEGEREVIASSGGGSAKSAEQRERGDASAVSSGEGSGGYGTMPGASGAGSTAGGMEGGAAGASAGSGSSAGDGGEGTIGAEPNREGGDYDESGDEQKAIVLPDDIPVDGSGDDVVGRQIREAAIAMQDIDPKAAEALWDEYRKHTGLK